MMLYDVLKASKGLYVNDSFAMLWGKQLGGWTVSTITGVLPLTFTAKGGNAVDWVIYGNDDNGTENLFDGNYQATFINMADHKYSDLNEGRTAVIQCDPNTQYTISVWSGCNRLVVGEFETEPQINHTANILAYKTTIPQYTTITTGANVHYIACYVSNQNNAPTISIVKGSTAPDHYIPYQQGVGEQRVDGYYVPLTISQQGQPDKTYDIYIGDTPLTEGETVSKTSTGQDIELFGGENTISTSLYNKPNTSVTYKRSAR